MSDPTPRLGRETGLTVRHWDRLAPRLTFAPRAMFGPRPRRSPDNWRKTDWHRYAGQLIGDCVGEAGAHAGCVATGASISPLHLYYHGRRECARRGIALGGEGCIVSIAAKAAETSGFARYEDYPATDAAYRQYSDRKAPPSIAEKDGLAHPLLKAVNLTSWDSCLDWMGQGYPVWVGRTIYQGMMSTRSDGYYRNGGRVAGGHSTVFTDFDEDANKLIELNSWDNAGWGWAADDPGMDPRKQGRSGIGWTDLDSVADQFSDHNLASGESEAVVIVEAARYEQLLTLAQAIAL